MKKLFAIFLLTTLTSAVIIPNQNISKREETEIRIAENAFSDEHGYMKEMEIGDVESRIGRKLKFLEKISFIFDKKRTAEKLLHHQESKKGISGLTIAGFTSAVVGLFFLPALFSTAGLVLSAISMVQAKKNKQEGRGLAIAGFVLGIVGVAVLILTLAFII
jgi:Domain of unknown function (DUF4190)